MVLLLRYTALRISDVSTLRRDRVRDAQILLRTTKNAKRVKLPVHADLMKALETFLFPAVPTAQIAHTFSGAATVRPGR